MQDYNSDNTSQGAEMTEDPLVYARKRAERAVEDMNEGPLKIAAFQAILAKLLGDSERAEEGQRTSAKAPSARAGRHCRETGLEILQPVKGPSR